MKIETRAERIDRLIQEAKTRGRAVPGRSLPKGFQWDGCDVEGRGSAAARRLRQLARKQEKLARAQPPSEDAVARTDGEVAGQPPREKVIF